MARYILRWREAGYDLVGPFETDGELVDWASSQANNPSADSRWAPITLHSSVVGEAPMVHTPSEASKYAAAGQGVDDPLVRHAWAEAHPELAPESTGDDAEVEHSSVEPMRDGSTVVSTGDSGAVSTERTSHEDGTHPEGAGTPAGSDTISSGTLTEEHK